MKTTNRVSVTETGCISNKASKNRYIAPKGSLPAQ